MSPRLRLENGEALVIRVTPVPLGLLPPLVVFVVLEGAIMYLSTLWMFLHRHEAIALTIVGLLPALVIVTRSWRWRSYKITLTTQRVLIDGGVLARHSTQINLSDVFATHAEQSLVERLRRRGVVILETPAGTVTLPAVRHPAALRRLVDRSRRDRPTKDSPSWDDWFADPSSGDGNPGVEQ